MTWNTSHIAFRGDVIEDGDPINVPAAVDHIIIEADATATGSSRVLSSISAGSMLKITGGPGGVRINHTDPATNTYDGVALSKEYHVLAENDVLVLERVQRTYLGNPILWWREVSFVKYGEAYPEYAIGIFDETVAINPSAGTADFDNAIPAGSRLLSARMTFTSAITLVTAVKVGLGISGNPDSILLSGTTMTNGTVTEGDTLTDKYYAADQTIRVTACDTNGAAAGTMLGSVRAKILYVTLL